MKAYTVEFWLKTVSKNVELR